MSVADNLTGFETGQFYHIEEVTAVASETTVVLPVGGLATRAREITLDRIPKHLIRLGDGRPVLEHVLTGLQKVGFRQFVFCVGQHQDQIVDFVDEVAKAADDTSFRFSAEKELLGPDGAVRQAVDNLGITGEALVIPGDMLLPWRSLAELATDHTRKSATVTFGVTSLVTERTTDVGRMITNVHNQTLVKCFNRTETLPENLEPGTQAMTSAAATAINVNAYTSLIDIYRNETQSDSAKISFRDDIAPWVTAGSKYSINTYDIRGEVLDLGTPYNITYGIEHWRDYVG